MFTVVDLRGIPDADDRGAAYGAAAAVEIGRTIEFYRWLLTAMLGRPWDALRDDVGDLMAEAAVATPTAVAVLEGIGHGSGHAVADLSVVSCRSELMARASIATAECTALRHPGGLAQTWDWFIAQRQACVIVRTDRMVTLTEAGMPAKIGCNADGLALTLNFLATTPAPTRPGVPVHLLIAELLEGACSVGAALDRLDATPFACSATIGLADDDGRSAFVELTPHARPAVLDDADGTAHTNHCLAPTLAGSDVAGPLLDNSRRRLRRATQLLAEGVTVGDVLSDTAERASSIDVAAQPDDGHPAALGTVAAVVIDTARRAIAVAPSRPSQTGFVQDVAV